MVHPKMRGDDLFREYAESPHEVIFDRAGWGEDAHAATDGVTDDRAICEVFRPEFDGAERRGAGSGVVEEDGVVDGREEWPTIRERVIKVRKMHEIHARIGKHARELCLRSQGIRPKLGEYLRPPRVRRRKSCECIPTEEDDKFEVRCFYWHGTECVHEFFRISTNTRSAGHPVESCVDPDAHSAAIIAKRVAHGGSFFWKSVLLTTIGIRGIFIASVFTAKRWLKPS